MPTKQRVDTEGRGSGSQCEVPTRDMHISYIRLVGVPQAGQTDSFPGCDPYKRIPSSACLPMSPFIPQDQAEGILFHLARV